MPNMTVLDPCDALEIEQAVPAMVAHQGPVYMRLLRGNVPLVLDEYGYQFELGKAKMLRDGADVLVISSGIMTMRALEVAKSLEADKVDVAVLHVRTIKPLDGETILREAARTGRMVVVAENHRHRRSGRGGRRPAAPLRGGAEVPADRLAGRVPARRRAADPARPLRHLGRSHVHEHQGLAGVGLPQTR